MSNWFTTNTGDVTHYCRGCELEDKRSNKVKVTQTEASYWFHPVTVKDSTLTCCACQSTIQIGDEILVQMGE